MRQNKNNTDATKTSISEKIQRFIDNFSKKRISGSKVRMFCVLFISFLPQLLVYYTFMSFNGQRHEFYSATKFELNEDLLFTFDDHNDNFDVYIVNRNADIDLIYFHGVSIAEDDYKKRLQYLKNNTECNIILPFYRNFCTSKGKLSDITAMKDLHILSHKLKNRKKKTFVYGLSFGCAASIYFANQYNVLGMLLENPFYDLKSVVKDFKLRKYFCFLITDNWPNYKYIVNISCPVIFALSVQDKLIKPETNGKLLSDMCKNDTVYYSENAEHGDMFEKDENHKKYLKILLA